MLPRSSRVTENAPSILSACERLCPDCRAGAIFGRVPSWTQTSCPRCVCVPIHVCIDSNAEMYTTLESIENTRLTSARSATPKRVPLSAESTPDHLSPTTAASANAHPAHTCAESLTSPKRTGVISKTASPSPAPTAAPRWNMPAYISSSLRDSH